MGFAASVGLFVAVLAAVWMLLRRLSGGDAGSPLVQGQIDDVQRRRRALDAAEAQVLAEIEAEAEVDDSIGAFKARLTRWPVPEVEGASIALTYQGDAEARLVTVGQVLVGEGAFYLDCWWPARDDSRLFRGDRVESIVAADGVQHSAAAHWLMRSGPAGAGLGDALGWRLPG